MVLRTLLGTKPLLAIPCTNTLHALNDGAYILISGQYESHCGAPWRAMRLGGEKQKQKQSMRPDGRGVRCEVLSYFWGCQSMISREGPKSSQS